MTAVLPPHVATADEPIPAPSAHPAGANEPDMRAVTPLETMLARLAHKDSNAGFVDQFISDVHEIGCTLMAHYQRDGELGLSVGSPCDPQVRHRSRWMHFLIGRLDAVEGRRDLLLAMLLDRGPVWDERPAVAAVVAGAVREYLRTGGRILIDPEGNLTEGASIPRRIYASDELFHAACMATRTYHAVRGRPGATRAIRRIVTRLGVEANGWTVLRGVAA